jgi:hypothetical protein
MSESQMFTQLPVMFIISYKKTFQELIVVMYLHAYNITHTPNCNDYLCIAIKPKDTFRIWANLGFSASNMNVA